VHKAYDTPCQASLGVKDAWFVMWPDGYFSWKFYGGYANLDKILDAAEPRSVSVSLFQISACSAFGRFCLNTSDPRFETMTHLKP
jgi:hypothetical protein